MYLEDIEVFLSDDSNYLVDIYTGDIFILDDREKFLNIYKSKQYDNEDDKDLYKFIMRNLERQKKSNNPGDISTLRINISNTCNLACKYCYASGGNYGNTDSILSMKVATDIVNFIKKEMSDIHNIFFFGGEPLLNIDVIEYICSNFPEKSFQLITNGTIVNTKIISVIKKYDIKLAISLDGSKDVHNQHRITRDKKPTFNIIIDNINKLKQNGVDITGIQATYTDSTSKVISKEELIDFFDYKFNWKTLTIGNDSNSDKLNYTESSDNVIKYIKEKEKLLMGLTTNALMSIKLESAKRNKCGASNNMVLIYSNGDIYPCQRFIEDDENALSNIYSFDRDKFNFNRKKFNQTFLRHNKCKKCIAKYVCNACLRDIEKMSKEKCDNVVNKCIEIYSKIPVYIKDEELMYKFDNLLKIFV